MTGDAPKAQEAFQDTLREAAFHVANGEAPSDRLWFFREARWRCLAACEKGIQPEANLSEMAEISETAPQQIAQLDPEQLAIWISAAPDPQRSALALFYLNEFSYREIIKLLGIKLSVFADALTRGRRELQAWLHTTMPAA